VLIVEEERAKEPPIEHPLGIFFSHSRSCCTVPLARPTELNRIGGDGGRNEEATGSGAGQSVGQPVGLSFPARFARSAWECKRYIKQLRFFARAKEKRIGVFATT